MRLKALVAVIENNRKHKAGETFEADAETASVLLDMGWAEAVKTAEKKKSTRKGAAK